VAGSAPRQPCPRPNMDPTPALLIEGFTRPFTKSQVDTCPKMPSVVASRTDMSFELLFEDLLMLINHEKKDLREILPVLILTTSRTAAHRWPVFLNWTCVRCKLLPQLVRPLMRRWTLC